MQSICEIERYTYNDYKKLEGDWELREESLYPDNCKAKIYKLKNGKYEKRRDFRLFKI